MIKKEKRKMGNDMKSFIVFSIIVALGISLLLYNILKPKLIVSIDNVKVNSTQFQYYYVQNLSVALQSKDTSMDDETFLASTYGSGTVKDSIKEQSLTQVVQTKVLLLEAKKDKFKANTKEINQEWEAFEDNLLLNAQDSKMTLKQFSKVALGVNLGTAEKYYKEYLKSQMYMAAKTEEVVIDKNELATFYETNKKNLDRAVIRHILVACAENATDKLVDEKKKLAESILVKVNKGDAFEALAKEYSEDTGSKDNGGVYEIQPNGQMVTEFENWTFSHKPGDTGIVRTSFGFHIMKLDSIYNTFESQSKEIELAYKSNKYQSTVQEYMYGGKYKVDIKDAYSTY